MGTSLALIAAAIMGLATLAPANALPAARGLADEGGGGPRHNHPADRDHDMPSNKLAPLLTPSTGGEWKVKPSPLPINAIHAVAGPGGKILLIAGSGNNPAAITTPRTLLWDTTTDVMREVATPADFFCAGHVILPDGRALVLGGTKAYRTATTKFKGLRGIYAFNFSTESYEKLGDMAVGRWYPTAIKLGDGKILVVAGFDGNGIPTNITELFDPKTGQMQVLSGSSQLWPNYPSLFLAGDGRLFNAGTFTGGGAPSRKNGFWKWENNVFQPLSSAYPTTVRGAGVAGFVGPVQSQRLMVAGGYPLTTGTKVFNLKAKSVGNGPALPHSKAYPGYVNLPDGTALVANGCTTNHTADAVYDTSLLNAAGTTFTEMNPQPSPRCYHSLLFLLDDNRVASLTSNPDDGDARDYTIAVFSPAYKFKGAAPSLNSYPTELVYGQSYSVNDGAADGATITRASLIVPPAVTHSTDVNQRLVDLAYNRGTISVPSSPNIAPPGVYRLVVVDSLGRPSDAKWVHLNYCQTHLLNSCSTP